jgi:phospholipase/carboxylesterase
MRPALISRREAVSRIALGAATVGIGCALGESPEFAPLNNGRLSARPLANAGPPNPGLTPLLLDSGRDGVVFVPDNLVPGEPVPLVVMLHGAGGSARAIEEVLRPITSEAGCVFLFPDSRAPTWDAIGGGYGLDVEFLNSALTGVFRNMTVDPERIAIAGFSDGASYALGIGRINGDLFTRVLAFSPGFLPPGEAHGKPPVFISHGIDDRVLPLEATSRIIVEELGAQGYDVTFREFAGGHAMSAALTREALALVTGASGT